MVSQKYRICGLQLWWTYSYMVNHKLPQLASLNHNSWKVFNNSGEALAKD